MWRKGKTTTHLTLSQSQRKYVVSSWSLAYVVASVWQTWFVQSIDSLSSGAHWYPYLKTKSFILVFWIWLASHPWKQYQLVLKEFVCWYEEKLRELITRKSWTHCLIPIHLLKADFHFFWKQKQWKWKCTLENVIPSSGLCYFTWKCFCESPFHSTPLEEVKRKFIDFMLCVLRNK